MECPNCHKSGNALKRIFSRRKGFENRFCVYCNAEVRVIYNWKKIFFLVAAVIGVLIIINIILQSIGWPGISGGFAGGMGGSVIAVFMHRPPFVNIELVKEVKKKRRN
jgi:hypothetical protein